MWSEEIPLTPAEEAELEAEYAAQAAAEIAAEEAAERWFEERGMGGRDLQEDMEHSPFDPIWAL